MSLFQRNCVSSCTHSPKSPLPIGQGRGANKGGNRSAWSAINVDRPTPGAKCKSCQTPICFSHLSSEKANAHRQQRAVSLKRHARTPLTAHPSRYARIQPQRHSSQPEKHTTSSCSSDVSLHTLPVLHAGRDQGLVDKLGQPSHARTGRQGEDGRDCSAARGGADPSKDHMLSSQLAQRPSRTERCARWCRGARASHSLRGRGWRGHGVARGHAAGLQRV